MPKVTFNNEVTQEEEDIRLNNGSVVILNYPTGGPFKAYLVTSFRNSKTTSNPRWDDTAQYCSLVDLATGNIAFEEPCSRKTTRARIVEHLTKKFPGSSSYAYRSSCAQNWTISIHNTCSLNVITGK